MSRYHDFVEDYFFLGFICALVIILMVGLFGGVIFAENRQDEAFEHNVYVSIWPNIELTDTELIESGETIKKILDNQPNTTEQLANLTKLFNLDRNYLEIIFNKQDNLVNVMNGNISDISELVSVSKWSDFLKMFGLFSWLAISLCTTINFVAMIINHEESLFDLDWKKPWTYLFLLLMSPFVLPCMFVELFFRGVLMPLIKIIKAKPIESPHVNNETPRLVIQPEDLIVLRINTTKKLIRRLKKNVSVTREAFLSIYMHYVNNQASELKREVENSKSSLRVAGDKIKKAQIEYAQSQTKLSQWQDNIETVINKTKNDLLENFDMILKMPHVTAVDFHQNNLRIYTDMVFIDYEEIRYKLGIFRITIDPLTEEVVRIENLCSTHPSRYVHPYSQDGFNFCFGELSQPIQITLKAREFASAVHFILRAIYSLDGDNSKDLHGWKQVEK